MGRENLGKDQRNVFAGALAGLPAHDQGKLDQLNIKLSDMLHDRCIKAKDLEVKASIDANYFRKCINQGNKRKVTREMLAKFVVGLQLDFELADELFTLQSYPLDADHVLLDAVVIHCLEENLDISGFFDTCEQVGLDII